MGDLPTCMPVPHVYIVLAEARRMHQMSETSVKAGCMLPCPSWVLNLGPLEGQFS